MAFLSFVPEKRCSLAEKGINKMCDLEMINLTVQSQQEGILQISQNSITGTLRGRGFLVPKSSVFPWLGAMPKVILSQSHLASSTVFSKVNALESGLT